jgi:hypothetical protein
MNALRSLAIFATAIVGWMVLMYFTLSAVGATPGLEGTPTAAPSAIAPAPDDDVAAPLPHATGGGA